MSHSVLSRDRLRASACLSDAPRPSPPWASSWGVRSGSGAYTVVRSPSTRRRVPAPCASPNSTAGAATAAPSSPMTTWNSSTRLRSRSPCPGGGWSTPQQVRHFPALGPAMRVALDGITVAPYGYALVQLASGGGSGAPLPGADFTGSPESEREQGQDPPAAGRHTCRSAGLRWGERGRRFPGVRSRECHGSGQVFSLRGHRQQCCRFRRRGALPPTPAAQPAAPCASPPPRHRNADQRAHGDAHAAADRHANITAHGNAAKHRRKRPRCRPRRRRNRLIHPRRCPRCHRPSRPRRRPRRRRCRPRLPRHYQRCRQPCRLPETPLPTDTSTPPPTVTPAETPLPRGHLHASADRHASGDTLARGHLHASAHRHACGDTLPADTSTPPPTARLRRHPCHTDTSTPPPIAPPAETPVASRTHSTPPPTVTPAETPLPADTSTPPPTVPPAETPVAVDTPTPQETPASLSSPTATATETPTATEQPTGATTAATATATATPISTEPPLHTHRRVPTSEPTLEPTATPLSLTTPTPTLMPTPTATVVLLPLVIERSDGRPGCRK